MADPSGNKNAFAVSVAGKADSVSSIALDTENSKIDLTLNTAITNGQTVTLSYTPGSVKAADNGVLASIDSLSVNNTVAATAIAIDTAAIPEVAVPIAGATPVSTIDDTGEYTATITWTPGDATFAEGTAYTAKITIIPDSGYTLTGVAADFFTVDGATTVSNDADSGVVTAVFPPAASNFQYKAYSTDSSTGLVTSAKITGYTGLATSITIPSTVTFQDNQGKDYSVPVVAIVGQASGGDFPIRYWADQLTSITIPSNVTIIGEYAFNGCRNLTSITIPSNVTIIGEYAFNGCRNLTSIAIPSGVTSIGKGAFCGCSSLTSITIPSGVTSIGDGTFADCSNLTSIAIPSGITSIGDWTFDGCGSLTSITVPSGVTSIGEGTFNNCSSLTSITIPSNVTSIGDYAFNGCGFTSITIPSGVTSIGSAAFRFCDSLTSITIPSSVTSIGDGAFWFCTGLKSAYFLGDAPTTFGPLVFANTDRSFTIYFIPGTTGWTTPVWNYYTTAPAK